MKRLYPQHFAMTSLGFATGLRPSTLRPLRRAGDRADVKWGETRCSSALADDQVGGHGYDQNAAPAEALLPEELMAVMYWHVETQISDWIQAVSVARLMGPGGGIFARVMGSRIRQGHGASRG
jgi:hypothetical protein